jgi:hypothetical protein
MDKDENKRVAATFLVDGKTLRLLREYSFEKFGKTNMSKAIMSMANEYDSSRNRTDQKDTGAIQE